MGQCLLLYDENEFVPYSGIIPQRNETYNGLGRLVGRICKYKYVGKSITYNCEQSVNKVGWEEEKMGSKNKRKKDGKI